MAVEYSKNTLFVAEIHQKDGVASISKTVQEWAGKCELYEKKVSKEDDAKKQLEHLKNYSDIAQFCLSQLEDAMDMENNFKNRRLFAAYDRGMDLQGMCVIQFKLSKKYTPYVEVAYLLTGWENMPFEGSKRMAGVGSALIAKSILIDKDSKIIYAESTKLSIPFYERVGFVPTRKQQLKHLKSMKLLKSLFDDFIKKQSQVNFCSEESKIVAKKSC